MILSRTPEVGSSTSLTGIICTHKKLSGLRTRVALIINSKTDSDKD